MLAKVQIELYPETNHEDWLLEEFVREWPSRSSGEFKMSHDKLYIKTTPVVDGPTIILIATIQQQPTRVDYLLNTVNITLGD